MKYLITFNSTTATFKAEDFFYNEFEHGGKITDAEVVAIPYKLADSCFGLGFSFDASGKDIVKALYSELKRNGVDFKHFWQDVNNDGNFIVIDSYLKK